MVKTSKEYVHRDLLYNKCLCTLKVFIKNFHSITICILGVNTNGDSTSSFLYHNLSLSILYVTITKTLNHHLNVHKYNNMSQLRRSSKCTYSEYNTSYIVYQHYFYKNFSSPSFHNKIK